MATTPPPRRSPQPPASPVPDSADPDIRFTDSSGVVYLNGQAQVSVGISLKLSKNFQSASIEYGVSFLTLAKQAESARKKVAEQLRGALREQITHIKKQIEELEQ